MTTAFPAAFPADRRPIVVSGPSGPGKGTLTTMLLDRHPDTFASTVSHTTRLPRLGEVEGNPYFHVSTSMSASLISQNAFKQTITDQTAKGLVDVLEIEKEGVKRIKAHRSIDPRNVFIKPPSLAVLEARLRGRGTKSEETIQERLSQARVELEYAETPGVHDKIIVNDCLDAAFEDLDEFVYRSSL